MAQLRQVFSEFEKSNTVILVIGPEDAKKFSDYWEKHALPFIGLPDPKHSVLKRYGQEIKLFKFGRMPAQVIIDRQGITRYVHYGNSMSDISEKEELLGLIETLNS